VNRRTVTLTVAWRSLHNFFLNPALVVPALLFPLFFFTAFAGGLSNLGNAPGFDFPNGYTSFQFVFVLLQASAFGGVFTGFGIARDFESGFGRRLMLAAPDRKSILAGYALAALGRALFVWIMLTVIGLAVGMKVTGSAAQMAGLYLLAATMTLAAVLWAAGIAFRFRSLQAGPLMQTPVFLVLFLAPVYVPIDLLHGWVEAVAHVNPITAIVEAGRNFISGSPVDAVLAFGVGAGLFILFSVWALTGLRRAEAAGG
jgi:ABC-type multidrug transport system permease subunit